MVEICFLGTGGSVATDERDNTSFLIFQDESLILVDCPGSPVHKIKRLSFNPKKITSIVVTHIHPDHIYGLPSLVHSLMLEECRIRLFGSRETVDFCADFLDVFHLQDKEVNIRIEFISLASGESFWLNSSIQCTSFDVPHSSSSLAYYFHFTGDRKKLIYSGDTPPHPPLFQKAEGIDYLIHDSSAPSRFFKKYPSLRTMHTHSLELGYLSQKAGVKCLIPCHFFGELEYPLSEIEEEIKRSYRGRLVIPEDFGRITL